MAGTGPAANSRTDRRSTVVVLFAVAMTAIVTQAVRVGIDGQPVQAALDSVFELEGNAIANTPGFPSDDFADVFAGTDSAAATVFLADPPGAGEQVFTGGGSKDISDVPSWRWTTGSVPDKNQLTNAYAAMYTDPVDGDPLLYLGADRFDNSGAASFGFWLLGQPVGFAANGTFVNTDTGAPAVHTNGDFLVVANFKSAGVPTIEIYRWVSGALVLVSSSTQSCATATDTTPVCAISNPAPTPAPWPYTPKSGPSGTLPTNSYLEVGIDLLALMGDSLGCSYSLLAESRSSEVATATQQDIAVGTLDSCRLAVDKTAPTLSKEGDRVTYTVTLRNEGVIPLSLGSITDDVLGDLTAAAAAQGCSRVAGQDSCTFTVDWIVPDGSPSPVTNTVTAQLTAPNGTVTRGSTAADGHSLALFEPALTMTKTGPTFANPGDDDVEYSFTLTNASTAGAPPLVLAASGGAPPGSIVDDVLGDLTSQATAACGTIATEDADGCTFTVDATIPASSPCPLTNTVTTTYHPQGFPNDVTTSASDTTPCQPDLTIEKDDGGASVQEGGIVVYTISYGNAGPGDAPGAMLTETVPLNTTFYAGASTPGWICSATTCILDVGTVPAQSGPFTVTFAVQADAVVPPEIVETTNTVSIADGDPNVPDLVPGDNTADDITTITQTPEPAIQVTKVTSTPVVAEGDDVTFTITVTNTGNTLLNQITITDTQFSACAFDVSALAPGDSETDTCTVTAPADDFINTVTATGTPPGGVPLPPSTAEQPIDVVHPAISITKSVAPALAVPGDTVTYTIEVTNTGDSRLEDVSVTDPQFPACTAADLGSLEPLESLTYTCTATALADDFTNTTTATGRTGGSTVTGTDTAFVDVVHPSLAVAKTADPTVAQAGDSVTYTITVTNTGDVDLTGVAVDDSAFPACDAAIGDLAVGSSITATCTVTAPADDVTNTATATGGVPGGPTVTDTGTAFVDLIHPAISVQKSADYTTVVAGDTVTFTIIVTNIGDVPLTGVAVNDPAFPECDATIGDLAVGADAIHTCTVTAASADITNNAEVSGTPPVGPPVTDGGSTTVRTDRPALSVAKSAEPTVVREGDPVIVTITVTNTGDVPLTGVAVEDPVFPDCSRDDLGTIAVGATISYMCTVTAPANDTTNTVEASGVPPTGPPVTDVSDPVPIDVIHPALSVTKTGPDESVVAGESVTFTITVTNTGDVTLANVAVDDPDFPECSRATLGPLEPGASASYGCTVVAGQADLANTVTATGDPPVGPASTGGGGVLVTPDNPAIAINKVAAPTVVAEGGAVSFTITVTNIGDVLLSGVEVVDPTFPGCSRSDLGDLAVGESISYACTVTAPSDDLVNTAVVTGTPPAGPPVSDTGSATLDVVHPGVEITKVAAPDVVDDGATTTFSIFVKNTGDVVLTDVAVTDALFPQCAMVFATFGPGDEAAYSCEVTADGHDLANVATVEAAALGVGLTDADPAAVAVLLSAPPPPPTTTTPPSTTQPSTTPPTTDPPPSRLPSTGTAVGSLLALGIGLVGTGLCLRRLRRSR